MKAPPAGARQGERTSSGLYRQRAATPSGLARIPHVQIHAAAERIAASWRNDRGDAHHTGEVIELLEILGTAVATRHAGVPTPVSQRACSTLGRRLLELLRADLLTEQGRAASEPADLLALLAAVEAVREAIEPNWAQHFASRLSGPDGLDLVVEVAHDLRSPLTSILFLAETLQRGQSGEINELQRRQLGLIYSAALGLSGLSSDVIELARGGDRLVDRQPVPFSVVETLEAVQDIVRPIAEEKHLTVRVLPPTNDHRLGHPLALSRVLLNLTSNALKFTAEGFVEIVAQAQGLTDVEFSVRDTGPGIGAEALASLYQPFRRSHRESGYALSGTGLGLAICRKLVEAMGAKLEVETRPGWGTRFHFVLHLPGVNIF